MVDNCTSAVTGPTICLVEDDETLRADLTRFLGSHGYACSAPAAFTAVVDDIVTAGADLVLLDLGLPGVDGLHICRELRAVSAVPIIVLTSRSTDLDELMAMSWGADDYVNKPFVPQLLLARIAAVLRRSNGQVGGVVTHKGLSFTPDQHTVRHAGRSAELTRNEEKILRVLLERRGTIVSRGELVSELWRDGGFVDENTLSVNVNRLRRTLEDLGAHDVIRTVRGHGYGI